MLESQGLGGVGCGPEWCLWGLHLLLVEEQVLAKDATCDHLPCLTHGLALTLLPLKLLPFPVLTSTGRLWNRRGLRGAHSGSSGGTQAQTGASAVSVSARAVFAKSLSFLKSQLYHL